jgi:hypothetical protein
VDYHPLDVQSIIQPLQLLVSEASKALISWESISSRIITASFQTKQSRIKANLIQCYVPTYDAEDSDKDNFYFNTINVIFPITSILYLCISFAILAALPLWYMVLTLQVPSMDADLVFRRFVGIVAS